jgi:lipopolysaccharide transport system ATP-binding protein
MSELAIRVDGVGKQYRLGGPAARYRTLREQLALALTAPFRALRRGRGPEEQQFWALRDVSLEVKRGEVVGIIGRNGAGKSTLLKILSRITEPTTGEVELYGRVGSLLEVGTGFHPELTGRENVYLNGAILGMKRAAIVKKFDDIVAFAEVEKFIDTPVKHYSSGMYMRLAFAVAAHLEPEILVVDEVLAVGDTAFQKKCLGKMSQVAEGGRTVLFVSHNMAAVENLCGRGVLLEAGRVRLSGKMQHVIDRYIATVSKLADRPLVERDDRQGNGRLRFTGISYLEDGRPVETVRAGHPATIRVTYACERPGPVAVHVAIGVYTLSGQCVAVLENEMAGYEIDRLEGQGEFCCTIPKVPLTPGKYRLNLFSTVNGVMADWLQEAGDMDVESGDFFGTGRLPMATHGGVLVDQVWGSGSAG